MLTKHCTYVKNIISKYIHTTSKQILIHSVSIEYAILNIQNDNYITIYIDGNLCVTNNVNNAIAARVTLMINITKSS